MRVIRYSKLRIAASVVGGFANLAGFFVVAFSRDFTMHREPTLLSMDYTTIDWMLRVLGVLIGFAVLIGAF